MNLTRIKANMHYIWMIFWVICGGLVNYKSGFWVMILYYFGSFCYGMFWINQCVKDRNK